MAQEYTFVVDGTHCTTVVTGETYEQARADAASLLNVSVHQVSWLRPLPPLTRRKASECSQEESSKLNTFYSGVEN
jgi:hypothetical protein